MIQFLVTAVFVAFGLFILVVLLSLMFFVVMKLLGLLFPARFGTVAKAAGLPLAKKKTAKKGGRMEDRCIECDKLGVCPAAMSGSVPYPCRMYGAKESPEDPS